MPSTTMRSKLIKDDWLNGRSLNALNGPDSCGNSTTDGNRIDGALMSVIWTRWSKLTKTM
ncbi:hypothetical protein BGAL_0376g00060 [Botrytis galanthina]|uniref:Uncharacterized protein n=1 Tax=Botrytis galanthina TaxID=278940 RepID=A0A4S8QNW4_9HELO|nr:hypothetical protein BGAL_0376g00060 [Botrytis galanthina]